MNDLVHLEVASQRYIAVPEQANTKALTDSLCKLLQTQEHHYMPSHWVPGDMTNEEVIKQHFDNAQKGKNHTGEWCDYL